MKIAPDNPVASQPAASGGQSQAQTSARLAAQAASNAIDSVRGICWQEI